MVEFGSGGGGGVVADRNVETKSRATSRYFSTKPLRTRFQKEAVGWLSTKSSENAPVFACLSFASYQFEARREQVALEH